MKNIIASCTITSLNDMEQQVVTHTPHEWPAELYAKGNKVQFQSSLNFLKQNNINLKNKTILDVGCGPGDISAFMAEQATHVHGLDASNNMIKYAIETYDNYPKENLTFEHNFIENFSSKNKDYDLATAFFCFHWFTDKQQALKQISQSLRTDGELFATIKTNSDPSSPKTTIRTEMIRQLYPDTSHSQCMTDKFGRSELSLKELKTMLNNADFEIIQCELQTSHVILPDRQAIENYQRPVIMSRPFIQEMSLEAREAFFSEFIDRIIPTFQKTKTNEFIVDVTLRIVHARKK